MANPSKPKKRVWSYKSKWMVEKGGSMIIGLFLFQLAIILVIGYLGMKATGAIW